MSNIDILKQLVIIIKSTNFSKLNDYLKSGVDLSEINLMRLLEEKDCSLDMVKLLVKHGINIDSQDKDGMTMLIKAASIHNLELVKYLFKSGADLDCKNNFGFTALSYPITFGNEQLAEYLIIAGADLNTKNNFGYTPLMTAISINAELLSKELAQEENTSIIKKVTLHSFIQKVPKTHNNIIKLLLENGAEVNIKNEEGESPYSMALKGNNKEAMKLLIKYGATIVDKY